MPSLQELVHALPPELFDYVKDLVLAPEKTETLTITQRHYKPSKLLQLSTATRTQYAEKLYSPSTVLQFEDLATLCKWLGSLTKSHRRLIHHIRMIVDVAGIRVESIDEMVLDHFYYHQSLSTPQLCPVRTWEMDVLTDITRFLEGKLGKFKAGVIQFAYNRPINTLTELPAYAGLEEWATMLRIERATDKYLMERTASACLLAALWEIIGNVVSPTIHHPAKALEVVCEASNPKSLRLAYGQKVNGSDVIM